MQRVIEPSEIIVKNGCYLSRPLNPNTKVQFLDHKEKRKAVIIGRFQPFHNGHAKLITEAMKIAKNIYIQIGSSECYPNIDNPFTYAERKQIIENWIENNVDQCYFNIEILPLPDYRYNDEKWKTEVRSNIDEREGDDVWMVGFNKDVDSYWLKEFGWKVMEIDPVMHMGNPASATNIRKRLFTTNLFGLRDMLLGISGAQYRDGGDDYYPQETKNFLIDHFLGTEEYSRLKEEWKYYINEIRKFEDYPYKGSMHFCTADSVVICNNHLLVIERKFAPGKNALAIPGGHKNENETFKACAVRELLEEVKIKVPEKVIRGSIKDNHLFDHPNRCVVFNKPTVAQYIILEPNEDGSLPKVKGQDDANKAFWMPMHLVIENRNRFFDDHYEIVTYFTGI